MFDIGVYGPISRFVASVFVLGYGFLHLPGSDFITAIHPDYFAEDFGANTITLAFGNSILFNAISLLLTTSADFVPPMSEIYHYPYLCAGWFGLFLTAMNMIPVGQLDGGHIVYSMFGSERHLKIARVSLAIVILLGGLGILSALFEWSGSIGWPGWLLWAFILYSVIKVKHPPVLRFNELDNRRKMLGYTSLLILMVSFSPSPFVVSF